MFFFVMVFPFACPYPNIRACDDANQHTDVKSGVAALAPAMNSVVCPQPNLTDRIDIALSVTLMVAAPQGELPLTSLNLC